jgi:hypothetical protein
VLLLSIDLQNSTKLDFETKVKLKPSTRKIRAGFLSQSFGFNAGCHNLGEGNGTGRSFQVSLVFPANHVSTIAPHTHLPQPPEMFHNPDQAAHYHILYVQLEASSLIRRLAGYRVRKILFTMERDVIQYLRAKRRIPEIERKNLLTQREGKIISHSQIAWKKQLKHAKRCT